MLMAAPMMTSCSNDDVVPAEEVKSNIVTITIAPPAPATRVAMEADGLTIAGWELNDEVTLYKVAKDANGYTPVALYDPGVTFKCINPTEGTFSGDLGSGDINDYTFAVYGAEAVEAGTYIDKVIALVPKTMCSENLKDVVIMAAYKDNDAYTMEVVNNVMKIKNGTEEDIEVAVYGQGYNSDTPDFRIPLSGWGKSSRGWFVYRAPFVNDIPAAYCGWNNAKHFTLKKGVDSYVNMGMFNHPSDKWGIAMQDGTEVVALKEANGKYGEMGKLFNARTYTGALSSFILPGLFTVADYGKGNVKKVRFTKSNLYWDGSAFHFEANPTDYPTIRDENHVGHFFWTKTLANAYVSSYGESGDSSDQFFADGSDEAHKLTADGVSGLYVLSRGEWEYLLTNGTCKSGVTVGDKANCLVIAPDGFTGEIASSYTLEELNAAGLVCLPAAGYYYLEQVGGYQDYGFYWSSTPDASDDAHIPSFGSSDDTNLRAYRGYGCSIRAVVAE